MARENIATWERDAAWQTARTNESAQSLRAFIARYPSSSEADEAREQLEVIAGYRAEFGVARSERRAERERDVVAVRFGAG